MMRWVFNIFALLSFLLCVATVVFWVRSYTIMDLITFHDEFDKRSLSFVESQLGHVIAGRNSWRVYWGGSSGWHTESIRVKQFTGFTFLGIGVVDSSDEYGDFWIVRIPHFWLAYIFAGLPILWCFSTYRRVRVKDG